MARGIVEYDANRDPNREGVTYVFIQVRSDYNDDWNRFLSVKRLSFQRNPPQSPGKRGDIECLSIKQARNLFYFRERTAQA